MIPEIKTTRVFRENWENIPNNRIIINRGGSRSSKTYSLCQIIWIWLMSGNLCGQNVPRGIFSIVRKTMPALKASALRDFLEILDLTDTYHMVEHRKIDQTFKIGGRYVEFFPIDDAFKVRGRKRDYLWMNEANEMNFNDDFTQLALRTTGSIILDFNPSQWDSWVKSEIEENRSDSITIHSTYHDNPFLSEAITAEIEHLKAVDEDLYKVFCLGEYAKIVGQIYPKYRTIKEENFPKEYDTEIWGIDFGFENDPTAIIQIRILNNNAFIHEHIYTRQWTNQDISEYLSLHVPRRTIIVADSAEPKSIEELRRDRHQVVPARKGKDSVKVGINNVKKYNISITEESLNTLNEIKKYKWKVDAAGNPDGNKPIDMFNHSMDAIRYALDFAVSKARGKLRMTI